jgi:transaldolase
LRRRRSRSRKRRGVRHELARSLAQARSGRPTRLPDGALIVEGGLKKLVEQDGLVGVTSNPSIFEKAIVETADYDASLKKAEAQRDFDVMVLYERLAIEDIQHAADVLRPVYNAIERRDGYVSLEVSPISP